VRLVLSQDVGECVLVEDVDVAPAETVDLVAAALEQLRQVAAVLAGGSGDERSPQWSPRT
jgi:hypothetical protein